MKHKYDKYLEMGLQIMNAKKAFTLLFAIVACRFSTGCTNATNPHSASQDALMKTGASPEVGSTNRHTSIPGRAAVGSSDTASLPENEPLTGRPTITYIGDTCFLKFVPGKDLVIPIKGTDLYPNQMSWSVSVDGVVPAIRGQDFDFLTFADGPTNALVSLEEACLILRGSYTSQIKSGDTLTVSAEIVDTSDQNLRLTLNEIKNNVKSISDALSKTNKDDFKASLSAAVNDNNQLMGFDSIINSTLIDSLKSVSNSLQLASTKSENPDSSKKDLANLPEILSKAGDVLMSQTATRTRFPIATSGFRVFQLYTPDDYRSQFLDTRLQLNEIKAFPMPPKQALDLFGPQVSEHFYVVILSTINVSDQERIINTGLINAYGRALVYNGAISNSPVYSIPIQISPESLQQVYSDVSGAKWKTSREWIFRSLNFAGSLATAFATGYQGTPDLIKGLGLTTSTVIPGAETLWPDQVPNYLGNIVNFGMPELVKVPSHSSIGFKLLFFSRDKLYSIVSDPGMYQRLSEGQVFDFQEPVTRVVYLSFDTLEIPYENASGPTNSVSSSLTASIDPPSCTKQLGQTATFTANVSGVPPFSFQWNFNGVGLTNQTNAALTLPSLTTNNVGSYTVKVTDGNKATFISPPAVVQLSSF